MDARDVGKQLQRAARTATSPPFRAAYRAFGLLIATLFVATNLAYWINLSSRISPLLAMIVVISSVYAIGRLWKKYSPDVYSTAIRIILASVNYVKYLPLDLLRVFSGYDESEAEQLQRKARGKLVNIAVQFRMVEAYFEPSMLFKGCLWLPCMIAYTLLEDVVLSVIQCRNWRRENVDFKIQNMLKDCKIIFKILTFLFKISVVCSIVGSQFYIMSPWYTFVTVTYYVLIEGYIEKLIHTLQEHLRWDCFDGLEHDLVIGLCTGGAMVYAMVFILILDQNRSFLMFLAIYTNFMFGFRELANFTFESAIKEWANIDQFARATQQELTEHDDVCAVCLSAMWLARKTPCGHFFHGHCLIRCIREKPVCPICKKVFIL